LNKADLSGAYTWRGEAHRLLNDYEASLADYARAIEINPRSVFPVANRAEVYRNLGKYDLAIAEATKATKIDPALTAPYAIRGLAYESADNITAARADFQKTLTMKEKGKDAGWAQDQARTHLAAIERKAGNLDEALRLYDAAIRGNSNMAAAYNGRG